MDQVEYLLELISIATQLKKILKMDNAQFSSQFREVKYKELG